jgi:glycosyltransferase involved in cell wall biosynthesis
MKVAYILKTYPRLSQTFVVNEILAHEQAGLDLQIFGMRRPKAEDVLADVARVRAPARYLTPPDATAPASVEECVNRLVPLLRQQGITHVHAHFANSAAEVARQAATQAGLPWSFTAHARDIFHANIDHRALGIRLSTAHAVVTVSDFNRQHLLQTYGQRAIRHSTDAVLRPERLFRLYNGLDTARLAPHDQSDRAPLVLAVGRLVPKKGFAALIRACATLQQLHSKNWRCVIAGSGPQESALKALTTELGLTERVEFLGAVPPSRVIDLMRQAAVLAAPCVVDAEGDRDGLPTVLLEAMAVGCPVVASAVTGIPELVIDRQTGRLLPNLPEQDLVQPLARALAEALQEPVTCTRRAEAARRRIVADFDIHRNAALMREIFAGAGRSMHSLSIGAPERSMAADAGQLISARA